MGSCFLEDFPPVYARLGGVLYLIIIVLGGFSEGYVASQLIVAGDAAATAHRIPLNAGLWQLSVLANVVVVLCAVPLLWLEYLLLRPVSRPLVLLALLLNVVSLALEADASPHSARNRLQGAVAAPNCLSSVAKRHTGRLGS